MHAGFFAPARDAGAVLGLLLSSYVNVLMLCVPLGICAGAAGLGAQLVFALNFLALVPLALILGEITEDLAVRWARGGGGGVCACGWGRRAGYHLIPWGPGARLWVPGKRGMLHSGQHSTGCAPPGREPLAQRSLVPPPPRPPPTLGAGLATRLAAC